MGCKCGFWRRAWNSSYVGHQPSLACGPRKQTESSILSRRPTNALICLPLVEACARPVSPYSLLWSASRSGLGRGTALDYLFRIYPPTPRKEPGTKALGTIFCSAPVVGFSSGLTHLYQKVDMEERWVEREEPRTAAGSGLFVSCMCFRGAPAELGVQDGG